MANAVLKMCQIFKFASFNLRQSSLLSYSAFLVFINGNGVLKIPSN